MLITITWVSGSGKSSLAFHTIYKEWQFRYIESLSAYLRQFFNLWARPEIDFTTGLSPAIAIEQNKRMGNSRSTVGTLTEMDDFLRLLLSKLGVVHCHVCGDIIRPKNTDQIVGEIMNDFENEKIYLLQEYWDFKENKEVNAFFRRNRKQVDAGWGSTRLLVKDNKTIWADGEPQFAEYFYLEDYKPSSEECDVIIYGVFDRVSVTPAIHRRLKEDIIKMLARADKVWVRKLGEYITPEVSIDENKQEKNLDGRWYRVILLHGHTWRPDGNRLPYMQAELEKKGFTVEVPAFSNPDLIDLDEKVEYLLEHGNLNERTILMGHSLWSIIAMKALEQLKWSIHSFVSVAWPIQRRPDEDDEASMTQISEYGKLRFKRKTIAKKIEHVLTVWSKWDSSVPVTQTKKAAKELWGKAVIIEPTRIHITWNEEPKLLEETLIFLTDSLGTHIESPTSWASTNNLGKAITRYTDKYLCANDNIKYPEMTPAHFSPNRQEWACEHCHGLGEVLQVDFDKVIDPYAKYMDAILPWRDSKLGQAILRKLAYAYQINDSDRWIDLPDWFIETVKNWDKEAYRLNVWWWKYVSITYKGIEDVLISQYQKGVLTVDFQAMLDMKACPTCEGAKLKLESLAVKLKIPWIVKEEGQTWNYSIHDLQTMPISELVTVMEAFLWSVQKERVLVERILNPLLDRAKTIAHLGLWYLSTSRKWNTLSGGEIQRLRLAKQLWNKLTGIIYVLDEPTIWLDAGEIWKVIESIRWLQEMWNTIIVVEHNEEFMRASDWIVEVWPGAGDFGGNIIYNGPYDKFLEQDSLTSQYLRGKKKIEWSFTHKPSKNEIQIKNARKYNLQGIDASFKLGSFTIITWPSGAGKTTLMYHTFFTFLQEKQKWIQSRIRLQMLKEGMTRQEIIQAPIMQRKKFEHLEKNAISEFYDHIWVDDIKWREHIDNVLYVDQTSIWKTPRSCPATFVWVFDDIRKMFAGVTESKMLGFTSWHFSFNSKKWACPECNWYGYNKVELQFLPDTYVPCELCKWHRYKPEILDITRNDKKISEILDMYIKDAIVFFGEMTFIRRKLELMVEIWLGYLKMWQPAHMLSWWESQRLKLVKHLLKTYRGHTVYFLDEPTVWLHADDITRLLTVLKRFLNDGDTILMIEHEQSMLKFADQVIRLDQGKLGVGK